MTLRLRMQQRTIPGRLLRTPRDPFDPCARTTPEWKRLRTAIGDGHAPNIDPDRHTDNVYATLYGPNGVAR